MAKFFRIPFGEDGDRTAIPDASQVDDAVSYQDGWTEPYEYDPENPDVRYPERDKMNSFFYEISLAMQQYQVNGFPDFITSSDNDGSPYPYPIWAFVRYNNAIYYSLEDNNTATPTDQTKWTQFGAFTVPTGTIWEYTGSTLPSGWIWPDGGTIGNASSGGTNRANADTESLFTLIWNTYSNTVRPIQDSSGTPTTRGLTAAADFAANKRIPVTDRRGRVGIGRDDMGGSAANRITLAVAGFDGTTMGASGGNQGVALVEANLAAHTHTLNTLATASSGAHTHTAGTLSASSSGSEHSHTAPVYDASAGSFFDGSTSGSSTGTATTNVSGAHSHSITGSTASSGAHTHTMTGDLGTTGSGTAHLNVQPGDITNYILKL